MGMRSRGLPWISGLLVGLGFVKLPFIGKERRRIMKTAMRMVTAIGLSCLMLLGASALHAREEGIKIGSLVIKAVPGTRENLLIRSSVEVQATFTDEAGKKEHYIGEMGIKMGIDLSFKSDETLGYAVFSVASDYKTGSHALQGKYFGQKASAAVGAGPSVQLLIGGLEKSFTLQPIAIGTTEGYGASGGLGYLYLQKAPGR
jgi:hypothetical protein